MISLGMPLKFSRVRFRPNSFDGQILSFPLYSNQGFIFNAIPPTNPYLSRKLSNYGFHFKGYRNDFPLPHISSFTVACERD
jgi:hypothetical protein